MAEALYTHPDDNVAGDATVTLTSGTENAAYPLTNLTDGIHAKPFKATGTAATIRFTFAGSTEIDLIALGPHNLVGATVTLDNNGGMAQQTITIPANRSDGQSVNPFKDLSAVSSNSATQWTLTITGASANVAIGEVELYTTKRSMPSNPGYGLSDEDWHPLIEQPTDYGLTQAPYDLGVVVRVLRDLRVIDTVTNVETLRTWHRECRGRARSCLFVLDPSVNDARFVRFLEPAWRHVLQYAGLHTVSFALEEVARGPVL